MNRFLYRSTGTNVNAGHNPPYLLRRGEACAEITELSAGGTVLGLFPEVKYEEADIDLCPGNLLVAFTDGVTEALNADGEEFGEERLKELLRGAVGAAAEEALREAGGWDGGVDRRGGTV